MPRGFGSCMEFILCLLGLCSVEFPKYTKSRTIFSTYNLCMLMESLQKCSKRESWFALDG